MRSSVRTISGGTPKQYTVGATFTTDADRHLEVLHTPPHSPGSIALWEATSGVLFSGDTVHDGPLVTDAWHSSIDERRT